MSGPKTPPAPRLMVLQNLLLVPVAEIGIRLLGWRRTWNCFASFTRKIENPYAPEVEARIGLKALKRGRLISPFYGKCLARSVVLWWQLHRRGVPVTLNIGVQKKINFRAHAWVEFDGQVLNAGEHVHTRYKEVAKFSHPDGLK